jgi:ubiquinone/menaquinone biosynthesis C-methylase UbiE
VLAIAGPYVPARDRSVPRDLTEKTMLESRRSYIPAAGRDIFLAFYDPFTKLIGADKSRQRLIDQAELEPQHRVLDVGCGTGSLLVSIKRRQPQVDAVGLDPDPKALARARRKLQRASQVVQLDEGFADALVVCRNRIA